jgi:PST family polysaccharide transporter
MSSPPPTLSNARTREGKSKAGSMGIVKAGAYSAIATAAKLLTSLAIVKLVALYAGPEGVGKLGQFLSLVSVITIFAGGGISSGVVKYVAEYRHAHADRIAFLQSAAGYTLMATLLVGLVTAGLSRHISIWLLGSADYQWLILASALVQSLIAAHNLVISVINGFMDVQRVTLINIIGSAIALSATALLAYFFQLNGALTAAVVSQGIVLLASYPMLRRSPWYSLTSFKPRLNPQKCRALAHFSLMALASALLAPLIQIWVRNHLAANFSWEETGYWQAVSKVSEAYLLCVTMALSVYYLPKLSSIREKGELVLELKNAYKYLIPAVALVSACVYFLRHPLIYVLFSPEFYAAENLFAPQLIGDVLKIASFVLSYLMLAKAMTRLFIFSEVIFGAMYIGWVYLLTKQFGLIGVMYAFIANYSVYLIFNLVVVRRYLKSLK